MTLEDENKKMKELLEWFMSAVKEAIPKDSSESRTIFECCCFCDSEYYAMRCSFHKMLADPLEAAEKFFDEASKERTP